MLRLDVDHGGPREGNVILHVGLGHRLVHQRVDVFYLWDVKRQVTGWDVGHPSGDSDSRLSSPGGFC